MVANTMISEVEVLHSDDLKTQVLTLCLPAHSPSDSTYVFVPDDLPGRRVAGDLTLEVDVLALGDGSPSKVSPETELHPRRDCARRQDMI